MAGARPDDDEASSETFPGFEITSLRVGVKSPTWSVLFNVQNVFNNTSIIADTTERASAVPSSPIPNRPRTFSFVVSTRF